MNDNVRRWPFILDDDDDDAVVEPYDECDEARVRRDDLEDCR